MSAQIFVAPVDLIAQSGPDVVAWSGHFLVLSLHSPLMINQVSEETNSSPVGNDENAHFSFIAVNEYNIEQWFAKFLVPNLSRVLK